MSEPPEEHVSLRTCISRSQSFGSAATTRFFLCFRVSACLSHAVWFYVRKVIMQTWNVPRQRAARCASSPFENLAISYLWRLKNHPTITDDCYKKHSEFQTPTDQFGFGRKHHRSNLCSKTIDFKGDSRSPASETQTRKRSGATSLSNWKSWKSASTAVADVYNYSAELCSSWVTLG